MVVLHTCKNEEDPMKNDDARVLTRLYVVVVVVFFRRSRAANSKSAAEFCLNSNSPKLL